MTRTNGARPGQAMEDDTLGSRTPGNRIAGSRPRRNPDPLSTRVPWMAARRWLFFLLVAGTTVLGSVGMLRLVQSGGLRPLEVVLLALFAATFGWISVAFWTGTVGFVLALLRRDPLTLTPLPSGGEAVEDSGIPLRGRTALVMPAYNEDPHRVVPALRAMVRSLVDSGHGRTFDAFLLSDTDNPETARREEELWERWASGRRVSREGGVPGGRDDGDPPPQSLQSFGLPGFGRIVYRRRAENVDQKAGNISDFCGRWGDAYDYMVVLDADSLMTGSALVTLVRLMDENPDAGLVQTVPIPARQETLFGRLLQFAQAVHAPLFAAGQSFWQAESANYWGHNAIVRVQPFVEHCGLPVLPGSPPLGGRILSHDFVEAALLRRGGWKVYVHPWIEGSWEGVPGTIPAYATRDRRWAQGSLQHLRLLAEEGLHASSRVHFTFGAMGYVSSLLWLLLLVGSTAYVLLPDPGIGRLALPGWFSGAGPLVGLLLVTAILLLLPKFFALLLALKNRPERFGGRGHLVASHVLETLHSIVVAPIMMLYHSRFVLSIVGGRNVPWGSQDRDAGTVSWNDAWHSVGWMTLIGTAWAGLTLYHSAVFFLWLTPIFVGLIGAVPLVRITSGRRWGRWAREHGLFLVPAETRPHSVLLGADRPIRRELRREPAMPSPGSPGSAQGPMERTQRVVRGVTRNGVDRTGRIDESERTERIDGVERMGHAERVERALFDLQRGRPLLVTDPSEGDDWLLAAVEPLGVESLSLLERHGSPGSLRLVLTHHRARAMGLIPSGNGRRPAPVGSWSLGLGRNGSAPSPDRILHLSSALDPNLPPPLDLRPASVAEASGLDLARLGRLLPALVGATVDPTALEELEDAIEDGCLLQIGTEEILSLTEAHGLEVIPVSDSRVPLKSSESARFLLFRERPGLQEHLAVVIGEKDDWPDPVPVRLHSACLTGDLFGSLRCDCGEQLRRSLEIFAERGGGVLLYLSQEGRSIGLANKLRAYALQQDGLDTVDANRALGFDDDERRYEVAVAMLSHLGIDRIELLTNNPEKMKAMEAGGIRVTERMPLHGTLNRHNLPYVSAKVHRAGHWLHEMLGSRLSDRPDRSDRARRRATPGGRRGGSEGDQLDPTSP